MVHKQAGGKTYRIDRVITGVGRIAIASGTDHAGTFRRILSMLTGLANIGKLDVLAGIRDQDYAPLVVLHYYERGQLEKLPSKETAAGLVASLWAFQKRHDCGASYRADLGTSIRHVATVATKAASVADMAKHLRTLRGRMKETPVAFNRLRAHLLAFASDVQGKHSTLWLDVSRVNRFKKAEGQRPKTTQRRPLTVAELDAVCAVFADVPVYGGKRGGGRSVRRVITAGDLRQMTRSLSTTGMRPAEYWQRGGATWEDRGTYIQVNGTKTAAAKRPTFRLGSPWAPVCGEQFFRREFTKATEKALRVGLDTYSLRRTFAKLCEDAAVVVSRRESYMGHGPKTVDELYLRTNVLPFVAEDAALVEAWVAKERTKAEAAKTTIVGPISLVRGG